jgi:hypothetical protein
MKASLVLGCVLALALADSAAAGVVMTRKQIVTGPMAQTVEETVMVQGNKERREARGQAVIIDLDARKMYVIDAAAKAYFETEYPPPTPAGPLAAIKEAMNARFKRESSRRTEAGYQCEQYVGHATFGANEMTIRQCVSTDAPGAKEIGAFERKRAALMSDRKSAGQVQLPEGVPLVSSTTIRFHPLKVPASGESEGAQQELNIPPVETRVEVVKIETKNLPKSLFEVPAGYEKRQPRQQMSPQIPPLQPPAGARGR